MTPEHLSLRYLAYIDCLNAQDWPLLSEFVDEDVEYNGLALGLDGYREMLIHDHGVIPDLSFNVELLAVDPPLVACRLRFDCSPKGPFLGLHTDGKRLVFSENVFYRFEAGKIRQVFSVIDKAAVERQL
jgi:predicted ester cyclase